MGQSSEAGGGGGGADSGLRTAERRALRKIAKRGHHGATAHEIVPTNETSGLAIAAKLVRLNLVVANNANCFVLARYRNEIRPEPFVADDDRRTGRFEHPYRAPLPRLRSTSKPEPVDITGLKITKLPPGEAYGARDLRHWRRGQLSNLTSAGISQHSVGTKKARHKRLRLKGRDANCLTARALKGGGVK